MLEHGIYRLLTFNAADFRSDNIRFQRELGALLDEQWEQRWAAGRRVWSLPFPARLREPEATQPATIRLAGL